MEGHSEGLKVDHSADLMEGLKVGRSEGQRGGHSEGLKVDPRGGRLGQAVLRAFARAVRCWRRHHRLAPQGTRRGRRGCGVRAVVVIASW